jgi:hypothetical protein
MGLRQRQEDKSAAAVVVDHKRIALQGIVKFVQHMGHYTLALVGRNLPLASPRKNDFRNSQPF